tara:strand:- start:180 stop:581 length:402 start_codon:yes stop_codon:yes gene_type:complete
LDKTINFDLVSPEKLIFSERAGMIIVSAKEGDIGVLPQHSKLISSLRPGRLMIYDESKNLIKTFFVSGGFIEINPEKCIVLAEEVFELSALNKSEIEKQMNELKDESDDEAKRKYLMAASKLEALNSKYYEKI